MPWLKAAIDEVGAEKSPWPTWYGEDGVPFCSESDCPNYDGKRCELTGNRPHGACEPVVSAMARLLTKATGSDGE